MWWREMEMEMERERDKGVFGGGEIDFTGFEL